MTRLIVLNVLAASASICSYYCERFEMRYQNKKTISRHWETMLNVCILRRSLYIYPRFLTTVHFVLSHNSRHKLQRSIFLLPNHFTKISKVSTTNIFTFFQPQSEFALKLFLIFGQSEPHCSYKVVLIKKKRLIITLSATDAFFLIETTLFSSAC